MMGPFHRQVRSSCESVSLSLEEQLFDPESAANKPENREPSLRYTSDGVGATSGSAFFTMPCNMSSSNPNRRIWSFFGERRLDTVVVCTKCPVGI